MKTKKVVITGAGSGLGKMAAIELAKRGHFVYATTQYEIQATKLNDFANKNNLPIKSFKLDILSDDDRKILENMKFDVLINNAGISQTKLFTDITDEGNDHGWK